MTEPVQLYFIEPPVGGPKKKAVRRQVGCETCSLNDRVQYRCDSYGNPNSRIWWVGEAPGANEGETHEPFVGKAGQFHWEQMTRVLQLEKNSMYTGNIARCWPEGNRTPTKSEIEHCIGFLEDEIKRYRPYVIGALGAVPFQALTGRNEAISDVVGQEFIRRDGVKVVPFYHPSYLLRIGKPQEMVDLYRRHVRRVFASSKTRERVDFWKLDGFKVELLNAKRWTQYVDFIKRKTGWCSFDIETSEGRVPYMISSAYGTKQGVVAYWEDVKHLMKSFFEDESIGKVFQNGAMFDIPIIEEHAKCVVKNFLWDTFVAGVTLDSRKGRNNLTRLTEWALPELAGYDGEVGRYVEAHKCKDDYSQIPAEILIPYSGYDAVAQAGIYVKQKPLANSALVNFYMELSREVLYPLEHFGVLVDEDYLERMITYLQKEVIETRSAICLVAGDPEFNPGSSKQVVDLLFHKLRLPQNGVKRSKKTHELSADRETMELLKGAHKVVGLFQKLRKDEKSLGTYAKRVKVQMVNHRFHIKYWIGGAEKEDEERGAETGRLSSTLQNIPRVDKDNPRPFEPANIFIPDKGMVLLVPDYSQSELRTAAILSQDNGMISDFNRGFDAHTSICHRYLGVPEGQKPPKSVRVIAKGINFAKIFGATPKGLAHQIGCSLQEVLNLFRQDKLAYPGYWEWRRSQVYKAAQDGGVYTLFGFCRPLEIPSYWEYKELEVDPWMRQALNTPVQGTAAQIMLLAMLIIKRMRLPANMLMNIHDSAPIQVHPRNLERVAERVKYAMEVAVVEEVYKRFKKDISVVPWVAELETGDRLSSLKPLELTT
jgi:uracil-DNA glycosylase family 4